MPGLTLASMHAACHAAHAAEARMVVGTVAPGRWAKIPPVRPQDRWDELTFASRKEGPGLEV